MKTHQISRVLSKNIPMNANDHLKDHTCTDNYHRHNFGTCFTDGVKALCDQFACYWFLDIIVSYQPQLQTEDFQVWKLARNEDNTATVFCTNGNGKVLKQQKIPFTDFAPKEATAWVEFGVVLLPSEH